MNIICSVERSILDPTKPAKRGATDMLVVQDWDLELEVETFAMAIQ